MANKSVEESTPTPPSDGPSLNDVVQLLTAMSKRLDQLETRQSMARLPASNVLPIAETPDQILARLRLPAGQSASGHTTYNSRGLPFHVGQIVALLENDKTRAWRAAGTIAADQPILGVVAKHMYKRRRDGQHKFMVNFGTGIGDEGVMDFEMEAYAA